MKLPAVRYPALLGTSIVAGVFSVIVVLLMAIDFAGRGSLELFDEPQYVTLKEQLNENPNDAQVTESIRQLDQQLRQSYFRHRQFMQRGVWLLIGGLIVCLATARWAAALRRVLPHPSAGDEEVDLLPQQQRWGRRGAAVVTAALLLLLTGLVLQSQRILPRSVDELALEVTPAKTDQQQAPAPSNTQTKKPPADPEIPHPRPDQSEHPAPPGPPSYEQYQQQWPRFRGPTGSGSTTFADVPQQWDIASGEGVLWKQAVPLPSPNSPVVWNDRVFLSGATADQQVIYCYHGDTGELLWQFELPVDTGGEEFEVMEETSYAAPSVATDGLRVYGIFASGNLVAVDFQGQQVWRKNLGPPKNTYGHASSLCTHEQLVIVQYDQGSAKDESSKLIAFRGDSGDVAWEVTRAVPASWASPIVVRHADRTMVISCTDPWVLANDAATGQELWRAQCLSGEIGPSPVFADGVVYAANEACGMFAVRVDGEGDVTQTHVEWFTDIDVPDVCSPLVMPDRVLLLSHALLASFPLGKSEDVEEPREPVWEEDLLEEVSSSPARAGELVYVFSESGKAWIVKPTADGCERVAEFEMGEPVRSSPALLPGRLYIRGEEHLFCLGK